MSNQTQRINKTVHENILNNFEIKDKNRIYHLKSTRPSKKVKVGDQRVLINEPDVFITVFKTISPQYKVQDDLDNMNYYEDAELIFETNESEYLDDLYNSGFLVKNRPQNIRKNLDEKFYRNTKLGKILKGLI